MLIGACDKDDKHNTSIFFYLTDMEKLNCVSTICTVHEWTYELWYGNKDIWTDNSKGNILFKVW